MSIALPVSVQYNEPIPSLPENTQSLQLASTPVNGSTFSPTQLIQVDLVKRGFIVPDSIHIRYKATVANATDPAEMIGTPVFTPILRLETLCGSQIIDSINQYNQVANLLVNLTQDVASKYGLQYAYGYGATAGASPAMSAMDGKIIAAAGETFFVSAPLPCLLSASEKLIPAFAMPQIRLQFTLDSLANMFAVKNGATAITISNFEVCYTIVDMGGAVEDMVRSMGTFYIKSQSYFNTSAVLSAGTNGSLSIPYNVQFASIKGLFVNFSATGGDSVNGWGDSVDITSGTGDYSFSIGGVQYPQRVLSTTLNKGGILMALRSAVGSIFGSTNSLSVNSIEFGKVSGSVTTSSEPGKFWLGVSTEKLHSTALLTGISSAGSAILFNVNTQTALVQAHNVNLIINHDCLVEIDTANMIVNIKK